MRRAILTAALIAAAFLITASERAFSQEQNQPSQSDPQGQKSDAPQPQKKPAAKPKNVRDPSQTTAAAPAKDENPFPEAVSRDAARSSSPDAPASPDAPPASPAKAPSASADNPFPEDVSRSTAKGNTGSAAKDENGPKSPVPLPPGVSSSRSSDQGNAGDDVDQGGDSGDSVPGVTAESRTGAAVTGPGRAKKDVQVGGFYFQSGDYRGAYLRYKDAVAYDPTNVNAVFGLAEAARALKLVPEAERNYELYLQIVPDGSKAKEAVKALHSLDTQK